MWFGAPEKSEENMATDYRHAPGQMHGAPQGALLGGAAPLGYARRSGPRRRNGISRQET